LAGFFGRRAEGLQAAVSAYEAYLDQVRGRLGIW
jgi:hypothetical protein